MRLIVGLDRAPDDALVADLARTSGARLDVLSAIDSVRLYVFSLSADGPPAECDAATERLRRDPSVRSVDVDARRELRPE